MDWHVTIYTNVTTLFVDILDNFSITLSGHEPQMGLDTKTYWLTDRQSQCNFDFDFNRSRQEDGVQGNSVVEVYEDFTLCVIDAVTLRVL
jgi:hypothetical protein